MLGKKSYKVNIIWNKTSKFDIDRMKEKNLVEK